MMSMGTLVDYARMCAFPQMTETTKPNINIGVPQWEMKKQSGPQYQVHQAPTTAAYPSLIGTRRGVNAQVLPPPQVATRFARGVNVFNGPHRPRPVEGGGRGTGRSRSPPRRHLHAQQRPPFGGLYGAKTFGSSTQEDSIFPTLLSAGVRPTSEYDRGRT